MTNRKPWKFEQGYWQGPLWPIKTLYYIAVALLVGILLLVGALLVVSVVTLWT